MSVKPIQDDLPVSEVGENPKVNKIDIDSQILPLPPMTMGEFEDFVGNVIKDSTQISSPASINIEEPVISAPQNSELPDVNNSTDSAIQNALSKVSQLESQVADLLSQMQANVSVSGFDQDSSGLTTRDYVDTVLGGERNLEGQNLVEAGNFLGKEEDITFKHDSESNTFDMLQGGQIIQEDMTPREANDWIAEKERTEVLSNDDATQGVTGEQISKDIDTFTQVVKDEDVATGAAQPFPFAQEYMIIVAYKNGTDYYDLFERLQSNEYKNSQNGDAYIECDIDTNGEIEATRFIGNPTDDGLVPFGTTHEMCLFDNSGNFPIQTKAYIPVVFGSQGKAFLVNHSGIFSETILCENGRAYTYPMRS
tara:strand:+ start:1514 stop:2611 length:1098 start_codon:yes stop_codon:yes gene_type:complete